MYESSNCHCRYKNLARNKYFIIDQYFSFFFGIGIYFIRFVLICSYISSFTKKIKKQGETES